VEVGLVLPLLVVVLLVVGHWVIVLC